MVNKYELIRNRLLDFRSKRNWGKFHTFKNILLALSVEVAELQEKFLWNKHANRDEIADEIADVYIYLEYLAMQYRINIQDAVINKIAKNEKKYPVGIDHETKNGWKVD